RSKVLSTDEGSIDAYQQWAIEEGFEGAILRDPAGVYLWGYRSHELLKVKTFKDAEFEVVGFRDGRGKMEGHVIFECRNDVNDLTFEVVPKATMEERARMFTEGDIYVGRKYSVTIYDRSEVKLRRVPISIAFQEDR